MAESPVIFDGVWKKFRKGERHDSLRDLVPSLVKRALGRDRPAELHEQEFWALKDVSFDVKPGEALGIIGPNGAGKSTALKLLTKILKPTKGHCGVHGRVGALIEVAAGFHPDLTGRENVFLQGAIMGMRPEEVRKHFDGIVHFSGLAEFIDTPVKRYSSGMNAKLGFSIAAHLEPDVLIIDEVFAVGDFTFQQKCFERLASFKSMGVSVVLVSHNMQAVASLCDRALLLRPGSGPTIGSAGEITAAFLTSVPRSSDHRAAVRSSRLSLASGGVVPSSIAPGIPLSLDLNFDISSSLPRCGLVLQLVRSDGQEMFLGASNIELPDGIDLGPHDTLHAGVTFHPHLLRGVYSISVSLLDAHRAWPAVVFPNVASFVVDETTRVSGCAEIYPTYTLRSGVRQPMPEMASKPD